MSFDFSGKAELLGLARVLRALHAVAAPLGVENESGGLLLASQSGLELSLARRLLEVLCIELAARR